MSYKEIKARHQDNLDHGWADNGEEACDDRGELLDMVRELEAQLAESELRCEDADKQARKHFDLYNKAEAQVAECRSLQRQLANDTKLIVMLTQVVEDFLPNIGKCALQDYGKLNTALCLSGERLQAITGDKK